MDFEKKILTYLVDNYRKSKKDFGDNKTNRRTQVKPKQIYNKYNANDGDFDEISKLNAAASTLKSIGFLTYETENFGTQIQSIYFADEKIDDAEHYLHEKYGYVSKDMQLEEVQLLIDKYQNASPVCTQECEKLQKQVNSRKVPKDYDKCEDVFKAIAFIENNEEDLYIREVSSKVYGDSKYFQEKTLDSVCKMLRKYLGVEKDDEALEDEILTNFHIYKEPQKICIKGNVVINISGKTVDISPFENGFEMMVSDLSKIDSVNILASNFMTIENRTSYFRYREDDTAIFYLGGYANRYQRDFIKICYSANPDVNYLHFGDIDAGGFLIHRNLCEITNVDFKLFSMSVYQLQNNKYKNCLHLLTDNDIARLHDLKKLETYKEVIEYMLENNVKLEQEIVSLDLMGKL